jgi:hypothetical protein
MKKYETFSLEHYALNSINYLEKMVDENNQPYFNIFWTDPISAIHDWPDVCDVATRQLQAAVMIRHMTGKSAKNENDYRNNFYSRFKYDNGLAYRPESKYTKHAADIDEQTLTLSTLVTLMQDEESTRAEELFCEAVKTYNEIGITKDGCFWFPDFRYYPDGWHEKSITGPGSDHYMMMVRPLIQFYKLTGYKEAYILAEKIINGVLKHSKYILEDGTFNGHVHGHLCFLSGVTDYASVNGNEILLKKMNDYYLFIRSKSTEFGWVPEITGRKSDCIGCETCGIMDFIHLGIMLATNGYTEYWDDIERVARNHLVESQFSDTDWMQSSTIEKDTDEVTYRDIYLRMKGGYAGWSSPNHYLAYLEVLPDGWIQNESSMVVGKYRIAQNCCGGSGSRALFHVWRNILEIKNGTLTLNIHMDKKVKEAEIICYKPYSGITRIILKADLKLKIRIPKFLKRNDITLFVNNSIVPFTVEGNYLCTQKIETNSIVEIKYPLPLKTETISVGHAGCKQYYYDLSWKGDTVLSVKAHDNPIEGFSQTNNCKVMIFGGESGPGQLYRRNYLDDINIIPVPYRVIEDNCKIYF